MDELPRRRFGRAKTKISKTTPCKVRISLARGVFCCTARRDTMHQRRAGSYFTARLLPQWNDHAPRAQLPKIELF
jgi:hypothetical protein